MRLTNRIASVARQPASALMLAGCLLTPLALAAPPVATTPAGKAEQQLQAIRKALLEATLEQPTRVVSTAWVDNQGALHESAQFQSRAEIRGVRVLAYTQADGETQAEVRADVLPWGLQPGGRSSASCEAPPRPWRLPLHLESRLAPGFGGQQRYAAETMLNLARQSWLDQGRHSRRFYAARSTPRVAGQYLQALAGSGGTPPGWIARLELSPEAMPEAKSTVARVSDWLLKDETPWRWTLTLSIGQQTADQVPLSVRWEMSTVIDVPRDLLARSPNGWQQHEASRLDATIQQWLARIDAQTECEPPQFTVRRGENDTLTLLAGKGSGLRPGDRILLVNRARLPSQILDVDASMNLAMAEIRDIGPDQSTLIQLAGPPLADRGDWIALPF